MRYPIEDIIKNSKTLLTHKQQNVSKSSFYIENAKDLYVCQNQSAVLAFTNEEEPKLIKEDLSTSEITTYLFDHKLLGSRFAVKEDLGFICVCTKNRLFFQCDFKTGEIIRKISQFEDLDLKFLDFAGQYCVVYDLEGISISEIDSSQISLKKYIDACFDELKFTEARIGNVARDSKHENLELVCFHETQECQINYYKICIVMI